jgi:oligopeptide/dipeptide ABC transporter ATP-binding protein
MAALLEVRDLQVAFYTYYGVVRAVNGLSFSVSANETLGIVGESGSGKSVSVMSIMGLVEKPGYIIGGEIYLRGRDVLSLNAEEWNRIRGSEITMCFQNPMQALNPVLRIGDQIARVHMTHRKSSEKEAWERSIALLEEVNVSDADRVMHSYPHQLSGGMCQRVMTVIALICEPYLLILDEPTTGLDATVQNQLLMLIRRLREEKAASHLLITHDLAVVANTCDRVIVMYAGREMEEADVQALFEDPKHPYTRALLESIPQVYAQNPLQPIPGNVPEALNPPSGCPFHPRCKHTMDICCSVMPPLFGVGKGQRAACHLYAEMALRN